MNAEARKGSTLALVLATLGFLVTFYAWSMLGPLSPEFKDKLGLSTLQVAIVIAVPVLMGSIMRIPFGILTDRIGGRKMFMVLLAFTLLPLAALAIWHDSFASLIIIGFFLGFAGASFAIGVPFVNKWFPPERQGWALGIYGIGMGGTVVGGLTAPRIAKATNLTVPFIVAIGLIGITLALFVLFAHDSPAFQPSTQKGSFLAPLKVFKERPAAWAPTLYYFLVFGGFVAMFAFLPVFLKEVHHLDKPDAAARAAGFAAVAVVGRPLGGWISDKVGAANVLRVAFVAVAVLAVIIGFGYENMVTLTICALTLAGFLGLGTGAVFKLVAQEFPDVVGAVTGVVGAAGGLGGFFPPLVLALIYGATGSYTIAFILLAATAVLCLVVLTLMTQHGRNVTTRAAAN
ncbi:MAG: NarK/NasA family nitrate transporter [Actinobacteria bacterium]|nr:NarK/NasA family nitrate transporter [Actinomycetota bacterium]